MSGQLGTDGGGCTTMLVSVGPALRALSAVAVEIGWVSAHAATYPLGLLRDRGDELNPQRFRTDGLPLAQRSLLGTDVEAATTPIVLIHGIVDNRTVFAMLRRALRKRGFSRIRSFSYGPQTTDLRAAAERLGEFVENLCEETGCDRVQVVGHSLGGLIGRYYVQCLGGARRVRTLVTLGTPHHGTNAARFVPWPLVQQLRPDSPVIKELAGPARQCDTRIVAIHSDVDQMIVPPRNARLSHPDLRAENVLVRGVGHLSLPVNTRIVHLICTTLADQTALGEISANVPEGEPGMQEQIRVLRNGLG
ncbi:MAG: esterase/lipase family protein [Nocardioidaceae bacterium]